MPANQPTTAELKAAFKASGLWRSGWTFMRALETACTRIGLCIQVDAMRKKQNGKPAPVQQALI